MMHFLKAYKYRAKAFCELLIALLAWFGVYELLCFLIDDKAFNFIISAAVVGIISTFCNAVE